MGLSLDSKEKKKTLPIGFSGYIEYKYQVLKVFTSFLRASFETLRPTWKSFIFGGTNGFI